MRITYLWAGLMLAPGPLLSSSFAQGINDTPESDKERAPAPEGLEPHYLSPLTVDNGKD